MRPTALGPAQQANNLVCRCQGRCAKQALDVRNEAHTSTGKACPANVRERDCRCQSRQQTNGAFSAGTALLLRDNLLSWVPDAQVPEEVRKALDAQNAAMSSEQVESALRIPLSCGEAREDMDRQGEACTVVDVVFNDDVLTQSRAFRCAVLHRSGKGCPWVRQFRSAVLHGWSEGLTVLFMMMCWRRHGLPDELGCKIVEGGRGKACDMLHTHLKHVMALPLQCCMCWQVYDCLWVSQCGTQHAICGLYKV